MAVDKGFEQFRRPAKRDLFLKLIARQFDVKLSEVSASRLMKRIGFTPQRPLYRAWQPEPNPDALV